MLQIFTIIILQISHVVQHLHFTNFIVNCSTCIQVISFIELWINQLNALQNDNLYGEKYLTKIMLNERKIHIEEIW